MKPFSIYQTCKASFALQQEQLAVIIAALVQPDIIYLLGSSLFRRRSESIFCSDAPSAQHTADYYLLILLPNFGNKQQYEWQEQIEQRCSSLMTVTTIVLKTSTFNDWLIAGHPFAVTVLNEAVPIYNEEKLVLNTCVCNDIPIQPSLPLEFNKDGLNKAEAFFAGAELFRIREQFNMAAFMLHQATEQALRTLLKTGTGYYSNTHNLDRLIRYAAMVSYKLLDIFPRQTEKDKQLFKVLQKAYSDARYSDEYKIGNTEIESLTQKVRNVIILLSDYENALRGVSSGIHKL